MMAHKAETAVQGWSVDPMEDVIWTHTHTHTHTHTRARAHAYTTAEHFSVLVKKEKKSGRFFFGFNFFFSFSFTVIAEIFVRVKISYSSDRELSYAINFHTARMMSHTLVCVQNFRMLLNFVHSAKKYEIQKLNRVRKFLRLQYWHSDQLCASFMLCVFCVFHKVFGEVCDKMCKFSTL